jgi:hypothetical protein
MRIARSAWSSLVALFAVGCGASGDDASAGEPSSTEAGGSTVSEGGAAAGGATGASGKTGTGGAAGDSGSRGTGGSAGATGTGSGGSTGSGGAGTSGTGGNKPPADAGPPRPCTGLPAPGTWENISPVVAVVGDTSGNNYAEAVVVDPFDSATVWFATGYRGIFKSTDCGATFTHVNTGRGSKAFDNGSHVSMAVDPVEPGVMYAVSIYGEWGLSKSTNGGVDWDQLLPADSPTAKAIGTNAVDGVSMDPNDHRHLVLGMHANCIAPYAPTCELESTDAGGTWTIVKTPNPGWEEGAGPWVIDAMTWLYGGLHLWLTTDRGSDWTNLDPDPAAFWGFSGGEVETHSIPRGADGTYYLTCNQGIVKSTDGRAWSLIPNSGGRSVGFAIGGGRMYSSDEWSTSYHTASESDPTKWTSIPAPAAMPAGQGAPFIDYDAAHHVLYSSNFAGGLWRLVTP